jgi:putative hydrolase of the HAD superfamily
MIDLASIKVLFTDVGGVLLSNGLDTALRRNLAIHFALDSSEIEERHQMVFNDFEKGWLTFDDYLAHVIFFKPQNFSPETAKSYILGQSTEYPAMIGLLKRLKQQYKLKIAVLSNEGREIAQYRFKKFHFDSFIDYYIVSCDIGMRKPDSRVFQMALGLCQVKASKVLYIDDRAQHIEAAQRLGFQTICHRSYEQTCAELTNG